MERLLMLTLVLAMAEILKNFLNNTKKEIELAKQYDIELAYQPFGQKLPVEAKIQGGDDDE